MCRLLSILLSLVLFLTPASAQELFRLSSWNIQALGSAGSTQWVDALAITGRLDADIVCVQEIATNAEVPLFATFATAAGYPHSVVAGAAGTLSGSLRAGVMSRHPILQSTSHTAVSLSGDSSANDISRDILEVHLQVPNAAERLAVFVVHLKAGSGGTNDFRRAIEIIRLRQAVSDFKASWPGAPWIICGDLNEDIGDRGFGNSWLTLPGGLPSSYSIGSDITFPVVYDPFTSLAAEGGLLLDATQEDSSIYTTREASGRRLDYLLSSSNVTVLEDEIYNSLRDNGIDDGVPGGLLVKSGVPLAAGVSLSASDHYVVAADLEIPSLAFALYPGTGEDLVMGTGINAPPTLGPGEEVKAAPALSILKVFFESPGGTFDFVVPYVAGQLFAQGGPIPQGPLAGMYFDLNNIVVLFDGWASPSGFPQVVVPGGTEQNYVIPLGFAGNSFIFQTLLYSQLSPNGYVFSDAHRLDLI